MKVEFNTLDHNMVYLRADTDEESKILDEWGEYGVSICTTGSVTGLICKKYQPEWDASAFVSNMIKTLDRKQLREVFNLISLITDPLGQELVRKAMESDTKEKRTK